MFSFFINRSLIIIIYLVFCKQELDFCSISYVISLLLLLYGLLQLFRVNCSVGKKNLDYRSNEHYHFLVQQILCKIKLQEDNSFLVAKYIQCYYKLVKYLYLDLPLKGIGSIFKEIYHIIEFCHGNIQCFLRIQMIKGIIYKLVDTILLPYQKPLVNQKLSPLYNVAKQSHN